MLEFKRI